MFFTFNQNNSSGSFDFKPEQGISHYVIVEAADKDAAMKRAKSIGLYFDGVDAGLDCPCCGDRWYSPESETDLPSSYGKPIELEGDFEGWIKWIDGPEGFVHYLSGEIEPFWDRKRS